MKTPPQPSLLEDLLKLEGITIALQEDIQESEVPTDDSEITGFEISETDWLTLRKIIDGERVEAGTEWLETCGLLENGKPTKLALEWVGKTA